MINVDKITIIGMFIGEAYNNLYAFLNWYKSITNHLFVDVSKKIIVITDNNMIISTQFSNCIYHKVENINNPDIVKYNKFKYMLDSISNDDLIAFSQSNMRCLDNIYLYDLYDNNDIVATIHSSYLKEKNNNFFSITNSCSNIESPIFPYVQTSFFIIKSKILKDLCDKCQKMYEIDKQNNTFPLWYDESYFNKYINDNNHLNIKFIDGKIWCKNHSKHNAKAYLLDKTCSKEFPLVKPRLLEKPIEVDELIKNSFVISINDNQYKEFINNFKKAGFNDIPQYWPGIKFGNFDHYDNISEKLTRQQHSIIGCSASHISLVFHAKRNNLPYICIFEDDATPCEDCINKLKNALMNIPYFANIYILGWIRCKTKEHHGGILKVYKNITGSHAYIIFKSGYDEYIKIFSTINCTADRIFQYISNVYRSNFKLFEQKPISNGIHFSIGIT